MLVGVFDLKKNHASRPKKLKYSHIGFVKENLNAIFLCGNKAMFNGRKHNNF